MSDQLRKDAGNKPHQPEVPGASPTQYHVACGKVKKGPFSLAQLQSAARDGTLRAADMVLPDGTQKWRAASEIPGLFPAPPNAPPVAVAASAACPASLFISYRRADSPDTVKLIHERLKQRLPRWEIFYDHESIPLGEQFPDRLRAKVTTATAVLVIIGPKWLEILRQRQSAAIDHVREEVRLALEAGASVVPVLVGKAAMPTDADLAAFADLQPLLQRNGRPVRPDPDFDSDLAPIIAHLKQLDGGETIGTILDDKYTLTAEIGHGGMGVVYLAQQKQPVKRTVAIKLIKPGMDSRDVLARFDAERQALAVMDHPNIAKVLDAGLAASGRPFFVMEHVRGVPITQYCDDKKLTPQERLNLFIPVCHAVQHAHQKGIIHRDLKPSNVLVEVVDGKPVPKVIDFGLAKALGQKLTDRTLYTALDTRVGTLEYSAPEQAAGRSFDVDTRSDIYSLGVMLYELLTGALPFTHEQLLKIGEEEMRRVIRDVEPVKPSKNLSSSGALPAIAAKRQLEPNKLTRLVQGDLDWIVMKCLEKESARRYETANQLGQELERFLADEPVQAGPPSARYRMKKFFRRNKGPVLAAGLVLFALIAGIIGTSIGLGQAERARDDAIEARGQEEKQREKAVQAFDDLSKTRKEADVVWKVVDQHYRSVQEDNIRHLAGLSPVDEELAAIGLEGMQQLAKITPDDPAIEPKVARAHAILGLVSSYVGSFKRARQNLEKAAELYGQLAKKHPDLLEYRLQECRTCGDLAWLYWDDSQTTVARHWVEQALNRLEREYARSPGDPDVCYELGRCLALQGGCLPDGATKETKLKLANRAISLFDQLIEKKHRETDARTGLAVATYRLAWARFDDRDQQELLKSLDEISALDGAALKRAPTSPYLNSFAVFTHRDRAGALTRLGKVKEALVEHEASVTKARAMVKQSPEVGRYAQMLADSLHYLARGLQRLQRAADAQAAYEESSQIMDRLVTRFPDRAQTAYLWIWLRNDLADFLEFDPKAQGEIQARQELLRTLDQAVRRGREFAARFPDHYWLQVSFARSLANRGRYDNDAKRYEQALPYLAEGVEVYRTRVLPIQDPPKPADVTEYLNQIQRGTSCASELGRGDELVRLSQLGLEAQKHCTTRASLRDLGLILRDAAKGHRKSGRYVEAVQAFRQAIEVCGPAAAKSPWDWYLVTNLGGSYLQLAETFREMKDFQSEILANREYLKIISGPTYGAKIEDYLDPTRPSDEAEANRILDLIKKTEAGGMKRFTIPCDFNGVTYPFHFYVVNSPWPKHPLEDQARWLLEDREGIVPKRVMDSFAKLHKIAHDNNVSFVDLCVQALGTAESIESLTETPGKAAKDSLAVLKAQLVDLKSKLDNAPNNLKLIAQTAELYADFGQQLLQGKKSREAVDPLAESIRLRQKLASALPLDTRHRRTLAAAYLWLGKAHVQLKEFDHAYNCFHRGLDLLEQLELDAPSAEQRSASAEGLALFGELAEQRGDHTQAVRWYTRAVQQNNSLAVHKIANLLQLNWDLAALLPQDVQGIYRRMQKGGNFSFEFEKSGKLKTPTAEEFADTDKKSAILSLSLGTQADGRPYWAYIAVKPSKYKEFYQLSAERKPMNLGDYGKIVKSGSDKEVPTAVKEEMKRLYGFDENYEKNLAAKFKKEQSEFLEQQETQRIAGIVDMLKKKEVGAVKLKLDEKMAAFANEVMAAYKDRGIGTEKGPGVAQQTAALNDLAGHYSAVAREYIAQGRQDDCRKALNKEFDLRGQQVKLNPKSSVLKDAQAKVAAEIGRSHLESKETEAAADWITRAGNMASIESLFLLADSYEKGIGTKADLKKADYYRYLGHYRRGTASFSERRYQEALPDLKKASELPEAIPDDHYQLGLCYGKLGRWEEAIKAYQRSFELEPDTVDGSGTLLNLLEAFVLSERPAEVEPLVAGLTGKKWQLQAKDANHLNQHRAVFFGYRAIALRVLDKDATEMEKLMREQTALTNMDQLDWGWQDMIDWLKTTKLAPDRKAAVQKLLTELQGIILLDAKTALAGFLGNYSGNKVQKIHSVPLSAGKIYQVDVTGDFDTVLRMEDSQKKDLVENAAVNSLASNFNSRLVFVPTKDESYRLIVTAFKAGVTGKYTLKIQEVATIGKEEIIKGELTDKDEKYQNAFAHKHKIQLQAGRPYTIEMDSAQYDTRLVLFDPTGKIIAAQNDGISPSNYRLSRIDFTPQMTAAYVILVASYDPGKTGPYRLRVQGYGPVQEKK